MRFKNFESIISWLVPAACDCHNQVTDIVPSLPLNAFECCTTFYRPWAGLHIFLQKAYWKKVNSVANLSTERWICGSFCFTGWSVGEISLLLENLQKSINKEILNENFLFSVKERIDLKSPRRRTDLFQSKTPTVYPQWRRTVQIQMVWIFIFLFLMKSCN